MAGCLVVDDLQRLSALREERQRLAQKTETRRISALQKQAVKAGGEVFEYLLCGSLSVWPLTILCTLTAHLPTSVHNALTVDDQEALKDEGITLPEAVHRRQRKRKHKDDASHHAGPAKDIGCTPMASDK